ncbi:hypothetical protein E2C01_059225 [Portunus trituberculatus]|uniref:Uncharacterized protein n=1 Tax=Portunus trituberculatus TaxID=210409 RepID=A0A5B7H5H7_PORTR|nr:hypothetical protein [Portunus trituberculatus]
MTQEHTLATPHVRIPVRPLAGGGSAGSLSHKVTSHRLTRAQCKMRRVEAVTNLEIRTQDALNTAPPTRRYFSLLDDQELTELRHTNYHNLESRIRM